MLYHNMLCCQEYELHIEEGNLLYAGVDYEMILREAEKEADIVLWDGGNNDFCFFQPTVTICVADALREGHEEKYYPGEINMRCVWNLSVGFLQRRQSAVVHAAALKS